MILSRTSVDFPKILLSNVRSLVGKCDELASTVLTTKPGVICITETWLTDEVDSLSVSIPGYVQYRSDRKNRKGGGVAMYVKHDARSRTILPRFIGRCSRSEFLIVEVSSCNLFIVCVYMPPNLLASELQDIREELVYEVDAILCRSPGNGVIILGDFNQFRCIDLCATLDFLDIVDKPTRGTNTLDHILVSQNLTEVYKKDNMLYNAPIGNSDHLTLYAVPDKTNGSQATTNRVVDVYDLRKSNLASLYSALTSIDWYELTHPHQDVDECCTAFNSILSISIQSSIPKKQVIMTPRDKEWLTPLTKSLINERWEAYRRRDWRTYAQLKQKTKVEISNSKRLFCKKLKDTPQGLWKIVRSVSGKAKAQTWDSLISKDNPAILANTILDVLLDKYRAEIQTDDLILEDDDWNVTIGEDEIYRHLKGLNRRKSVGLDNIPTKIYSEMADCLTKPLKLIFDASIEQRTFPSLWKTAIICPIPKTNPPTPNKLRPVSLLPVVSKIFERIIAKKLWCKFEEHYGDSQHGFRPLHSTTTAVIDILEAALFHYDNLCNAGVAIISFDMAAAFDCLDHTATLKKFQRLGFPKGFVKWLRSYLHARKFVVKINGSFSRLGSVSRGIPQGSVLGPSIFSIFTSDLSTVNASSRLITYADDITIVVPMLKGIDMKQIITAEILNVEEWCRINKLTINKEKSNILLCARSRNVIELELPLPRSTATKILGVIFNEKLTWDDHMTEIVKKCNQRFFILRKLK